MAKTIDNEGSAKTPRSTMTTPPSSSPKIPAGARVPEEPGANPGMKSGGEEHCGNRVSK